MTSVWTKLMKRARGQPGAGATERSVLDVVGGTFDLIAHVLELRPEGPPGRRLVLSVRLENRWDHDVALLSAWSDVTFNPPGAVGVSGYLFHQLHARVSPAIAAPREPLLGEFHIPMSVALLDAIERSRTEHVTFSIHSRVLIAPVVVHEGQGVLATPREAGMSNLKGEQLGQVIARSDWIRYLSNWRWSEIELFELPFDRHRESPRFRRAFELLRSANERLRNGDYSGVLQSCRLVLESLAKDVEPDGALAAGFTKVLEESVSGPEMRLRLNDLMLSLSKVTHLARHEKRPHEDLTRSDAVFCLRSTLAVVARFVEPGL